MKDQYPEMSETFDPNDDDSIDSVRQANIYLGNLCTAVDEETDDMISDNQKVITAIESIFDENSPVELVASILLLISRLANLGDQTKQIIRESQIPQKIIDFIILDTYMMDASQTGKLNEFAIDALLGTGSPLTHARTRTHIPLRFPSCAVRLRFTLTCSRRDDRRRRGDAARS